MLRPEQNGEKLVRHLMPAKSEKPMMVREVTAEEHLQFLEWKIREEAEEVASADAKTFAMELGDLRQALADFCTVAGIKLASLQFSDSNAVPTEHAARVAFFRAQVARLPELAAEIPLDEREAAEHIGTMLGVINVVTDIAGIRDAVRAEMARKLKELGGFNPGIAWKVVEKPQQ